MGDHVTIHFTVLYYTICGKYIVQNDRFITIGNREEEEKKNEEEYREIRERRKEESCRLAYMKVFKGFLK